MAELNGKLSCAVAGLGRIGSSLEKDALREKPCTHTGAVAGNPDCVLAAGCDIKPEARERFLKDWGHLSPKPGVFDSVDELLTKLVPQILVVATYPESHYRIVKKAAAAGVPVIVCEKPLADTLRSARKIAALHRKGAATVLVNHERRYSSDYLAVREAIAQRRYGRLISVRGTLYFGRSSRHKDVLLHDGTHLVDIINFLLEEARGPAARGPAARGPAARDPAACSLRKANPVRLERRSGSMRSNRGSAYLFGTASRAGRPSRTESPGAGGGAVPTSRAAEGGGIPVVIEVGAERDHLVFEVELSFERGRIRVGNGVLSFEASGESPYYEGYRSLLPDEAPEIGKTGYFSNMIADAVRCARQRQAADVAGNAEGGSGRRAEGINGADGADSAAGGETCEPVSSAADGYAVMKYIRSMRGLL